MELTVTRDVDVMADVASAMAAIVLRWTLASGPTASLALSGGRTPRPMLERLAEESDIDWARVVVFQVDERLAPLGHVDRNLTMLEDALLSRVPATVHPMPVGGDPDRDAEAYAALLPAALDLVVLGLGADGHTASLLPGDGAASQVDQSVAVSGEYQGRRRLTLTAPTLSRADHKLWLVTGPDKRHALDLLMKGDPSIPATLVSVEGARVVTDRYAVLGAD
ncbi:MAG: 6-phosphogluconolactonase [Acidimicrobiia bacterium]|nr:6-phosphogluconolactonase [Acidimicrobiia bacterium]